MLKLKLVYGQEEITGGMREMINDGWGERGILLSRMGWVLQPELNPRVRSQVSGKIWRQLPKGLCKNKFFFFLKKRKKPLRRKDSVFIEIILRPGRFISSLHVIFLMMSNKNVDLICFLNPQICSTKLWNALNPIWSKSGCQKDNWGMEPKKTPSGASESSLLYPLPGGGASLPEDRVRAFIQQCEHPSELSGWAFNSRPAVTWVHFVTQHLSFPFCRKVLLHLSGEAAGTLRGEDDRKDSASKLAGA